MEKKLSLRRAGWRSIWAPAFLSAKGKPCAGTALLLRAHLDAWQPEEGFEALQRTARITGCLLRTKCVGLLALYVCYYRDSLGMAGVNLKRTASLGGEGLRHGLPVVMG